MKQIFTSRLHNTSKMLLHQVQDARCAVKKGDNKAALRAAREALTMAGWVITYATALETLNATTQTQP